MVKQFGNRPRARAERVPFDFTVNRLDEMEVHRFQIVAALDAAGLSGVILTTKKDQEMALPAMLGVIRKMLDNTDGVPAKWVPIQLTRRSVRERERLAAVQSVHRDADTPEWPPAVGTTEPAEVESPEQVRHLEEPVFRAPFGLEKGQLLPMTRVGEFLDPAAGSSRRRWDALLDDDDVTLEAPDLTGLFEWAVGVASGRPTGMSS
jgi:hypothetical protein